MTGRKRTTDATSSKSKLPEVPVLVIDQRNDKQYKKGEFLGKVSLLQLEPQQTNLQAPS